MNWCFIDRELQQSIAREPSAPSFNVPAYQSNNPAPASGGPTPAPRTVFVSFQSELSANQITNQIIVFSGYDVTVFVCALKPVQPQAKSQPPARPPPPNLSTQAASSSTTSSVPDSQVPPSFSSNPPPVAPPIAPSQAQGPPYPSYQGYPGYIWSLSTSFSILSLFVCLFITLKYSRTIQIPWFIEHIN